MAAKKTTDEVVLEMLRKVQQKKDEIAKAKTRPQWKTNCTIRYPESGRTDSAATQINIQTRDLTVVTEIYAFLLWKEEFLMRAANDLGTAPNLVYGGFPIADWKDDLKTRAAQLSIEQKQRDLDDLDRKVNALVSPEQRREMELAAVQKILGD